MASSPDTEIPAHMLRNGRIEDQAFEGDEELYRRIRNSDLNGETWKPEMVRFPNFSVNRSWSVSGRHPSEPEDVLRPSYSGWGILQLLVKDLDIPETSRRAGDSIYELKVVHAPLEDNFAHSEVRCLKNGIYSETKKPPQAIKTVFRRWLSDRATLRHRPEV